MLEHLLAGMVSSVFFIGLMCVTVFAMIFHVEWKELKRKRRANQIKARLNWRPN